MANGLRLKEDDSLSSTITFIQNLNDAFDILNIRSKNEGSRFRNKFKDPLCSSDDWRFEVCIYINIYIYIYAQGDCYDNYG